jgi:HlyD family secretion protein
VTTQAEDLTATEPLTDVAPPRRPERRAPRWLVVAAVLAAAALGWRWWRGPATADGPTWTTVAADRGPIEQTVTATGVVNPVTTVQVGTYVSGPIQAIDVDFNSPVAKGQRVARIDPAPFLVRVRQAEANLATARARLEKSRADLALKRQVLSRTTTLRGQGIVAEQDQDTARSEAAQAAAQLALDEAAVAEARARLDEARVNLGYTDILSPVDGVVVSRNVDVGQTVAASFQTPTLFLIAEDLTAMQVKASVSESDVGQVREGQPVSFTVDAYPGEPFRGTVAQVRNAPTTVLNVVTYDVVVTVPNPDLRLKPGMTATVTVTAARRDDVVRVPARALRFRPEPGMPGVAGEAQAAPADGGPAVWVREESGALRRVPVTPGVRDAEWVEVAAGAVQPGDPVVVGFRRPEGAAAPAQPLSPFAVPRHR